MRLIPGHLDHRTQLAVGSAPSWRSRRAVASPTGRGTKGWLSLGRPDGRPCRVQCLVARRHRWRCWLLGRLLGSVACRRRLSTTSWASAEDTRGDTFLTVDRRSRNFRA